MSYSTGQTVQAPGGFYDESPGRDEQLFYILEYMNQGCYYHLT